jgi:putative heme-binding domain-containing protein
MLANEQITTALLAMSTDSSARVREQLAYTLGEWKDPRAGRALAELATKHLTDASLRGAVLSSAMPHSAQLLDAVLRSGPDAKVQGDWVAPLVATIVGAGDDKQLATTFRLVLANGAQAGPARFQVVASLLAALDRRGTTWTQYLESHAELHDLRPALSENFAAARNFARSGAQETRTAAIELVGSDGSTEAQEVLCDLLLSESAEPVRAAVMSALRRRSDPETARILLRKMDWEKISSPRARSELLVLLLERDEWAKNFLAEIKEGRVPAGEIALADRRRLTESPDEQVKRLAMEIWPQGATSNRAQLIAQYQEALTLKGQAAHGAELFAQHCSSCHALKGVGHAVGPDLEGLRGKEAAYWLQNILDPNAVVEPRFVNYEASTRDGRTLSGIIKNETATTLTLIAGNGVSETVLRSQIQDLHALKLSLMPEGLEAGLPPQAMADLLAYVRVPLAPKRMAGNAPALVKPGADGVLMLSASQAEIFGGPIAFESEFRNVGMWSGQDDYAAWNLQVPAAGARDVYLDYACAEYSAGNGFVIRVGDQSLNGRVASTGPDWSRYRQTKIGSINLVAGQSRLAFQPDGALRNALIDLRTVALAPSGVAPRWPEPAAPPADGLMRDPASIGRFLLDSSQSRDAREAAIRSNPQFAAKLIGEMTRDIEPGNEYERIPWIWRVAIACGKRNETPQLAQILAVSLPSEGEPLRDWQAVVIGGGVINGISQRGVWPKERVEEILKDHPDLLPRWQRALDLAAAMADDAHVNNGTRYDALRMLGVEPWSKRGEQLHRYLAASTDAELQMGAVSALGDVKAAEAARALCAALDGLSAGNREIALVALLRDDERLAALAEAKMSATTHDQLVKLAQHPDASVRDRAQKLLQR